MIVMILSIDPGRYKCGAAVLDQKKNVKEKDIVSTNNLKSYLLDLLNKYKVKTIILGNGTFHSGIYKMIGEISELPVIIIDEAGSTEKAEKLYMQEEYNYGWKKLLRILKLFINWKPSQAVDDYAAVILGREHLDNIDK